MTNMSLVPNVFYHGTSIQAALSIQTHGFMLSTNAGAVSGLLGRGVYCSTVLDKAMDYAKGKSCGGAIIQIKCDLGRCKTLAGGDPLMKTWQELGFDSAYCPRGASCRNLPENCIKDASRIEFMGVFVGNTSKLRAMGMFVNRAGRLAMLCDEHAAENICRVGCKRKHDTISVDSDFAKLLHTWKLGPVTSLLADEGICGKSVLLDELDMNEIGNLKIGLIYKTRVRLLVEYLRSESDRALSEKRVVESVLQALITCPSDIEARYDTAEQTAVLSQTDGGLHNIIVAGIIPHLVAWLSVHSMPVKVVHKCCETLLNAVNGKYCKTVVTGGGVTGVMNAISIHRTDAPVVTSCLSVLCIIIADADVAARALEQIGSQDGITSLEKLMALHPDDEELNCCCFKVLGAILRQPKAFQMRDINKAISALLSIQNNHLQKRSLQSLGANVFIHMIETEKKSSAAIVECGGVKVFLECLTANIKDGAVVSKCCWLVVLLNRNNPPFVTKFVEAGGIDACVLILNNYGGLIINAMMVCNCFELLNNASLTDEHRALVFLSGGIAKILSILKIHKLDARLQCSGLLLCSELSRCRTNIFEIPVLGGIDVILKTMNAHQDAVMIQYNGLNAIKYMAQHSPKNIQTLIAAGALTTLVQAIDKHINNTRISTIAVYIIGLLTSVEEGRILTETQLVVLVKSAKRHQYTSINVQYGTYALKNSIMTNNVNQKTVVDAGVLAFVVGVMAKYADDVLVISHCANLIQYLIGSPENIVAFSKIGGIDSLIVSLQSHAAPIQGFIVCLFQMMAERYIDVFEHPVAQVLTVLKAVLGKSENHESQLYKHTKMLIHRLELKYPVAKPDSLS